MLTAICPKLPMRDREKTLTFYTRYLQFEECGLERFEHYLMLKKDAIELHFFLHQELDVSQNDGQVYIRVQGIDEVYRQLLEVGTPIHPNGTLGHRPWGMKEFALLDPDHNLLTFGGAS
jgi:catechol 2,3-dioxygenase-like lactoylglutathione lyase family enzyme